MSTALDAAMSAVITEVAMGLARKHNLVCTDESIVCWHCGNRLALLPSLACPACLGAAYSQRHLTAPLCVNRRQECEQDASQRREAANG